MKIQSEQLITDLMETTERHLKTVKMLQSQPEEALNRRASPESWSALECIKHLNLYGDYYLPEVENCLNNAKLPQENIFKSGLIGNYFAKSMLPKDKLNKMRTFTSMNPIHTSLDKQVLEQFSAQLYQWLRLLEQAKTVNLNREKVKISISKWIKLKLGDALRVVIYHNERHIKQAERAARR